jgi:hypothetical protein
MPLEDFIKKELPENIANVKLENSPEVDTVEISAKNGDVKNVAANAQAPKAENGDASVGKKLDVAA